MNKKSTTPVYAVPGEIYTPDMIMPPNVDRQYGYAIVDDERTRHFYQTGPNFPAPSKYSHSDHAHGVFYSTNGDLTDYPGNYDNGYLGYDGYAGYPPVNQWVSGLSWITACGTFASHIAEFRDHYHMLRQPTNYDQGHSFTHSDESNIRNKATLWWGRGLNGEVTRRIAEWMPPGTIVDDSTIGLPSVIPQDARPHENWKLVQPEIEGLMQIICENCLGSNILRKFHRRADAMTYLSAMGSGLLAVPDFTEDVWRIRTSVRNFTLESRAARNEIWGDLMEWNGHALDWFDENVIIVREHN